MILKPIKFSVFVVVHLILAIINLSWLEGEPAIVQGTFANLSAGSSYIHPTRLPSGTDGVRATDWDGPNDSGEAEQSGHVKRLNHDNPLSFAAAASRAAILNNGIGLGHKRSDCATVRAHRLLRASATVFKLTPAMAQITSLSVADALEAPDYAFEFGQLSTPIPAATLAPSSAILKKISLTFIPNAAVFAVPANNGPPVMPVENPS